MRPELLDDDLRMAAQLPVSRHKTIAACKRGDAVLKNRGMRKVRLEAVVPTNTHERILNREHRRRGSPAFAGTVAEMNRAGYFGELRG